MLDIVKPRIADRLSEWFTDLDVSMNSKKAENSVPIESFVVGGSVVPYLVMEALNMYDPIRFQCDHPLLMIKPGDIDVYVGTTGDEFRMTMDQRPRYVQNEFMSV